MALSTIGRNQLNTGIDDNSDATAITIDSSEQVLIGTTTEGYSPHASTFTVAGTGHAGITIRSGASESGNLYFSDATSGSAEYDGYLAYNHGTQAMILGTAASTGMTIDSSGNVGIGTTTLTGSNAPDQINDGVGVRLTPSGLLGIGRAAGVCARLNRSDDGQIVMLKRGGTTVGDISVTSSSTAYNTSSDYRLKQGVEDMTGAIDRVKALAPKRFQFIADAKTTVDGFLAHEAQTVVPEAVTGTHNEVDDDGNAVMQGIDQAKLVPLLVGALKESIAKIETLETEMADLKARVTALEAV
tara:strand:- start:1544 stop:2443 length:900 start_codon:yes stop_codon:yes gene_type:complete